MNNAFALWEEPSIVPAIFWQASVSNRPIESSLSALSETLYPRVSQIASYDFTYWWFIIQWLWTFHIRKQFLKHGKFIGVFYLDFHLIGEKKQSHSSHLPYEEREKCNIYVITFFCLCWAMGFPRGICFSFCISVRGDFVPREGSLFQGDGLGENRTFDRAGMPFLFCLSPSPFSSKLGTFCPVYWKSQTLASSKV